MTQATVKSWMPQAHLEVMKSTSPKAAIDYCRKEETRTSGPWSFGQEPVMGKRTDLVRLHSAILEGSSPEDLLSATDGQMITTVLQYPKAASTVHLLATKMRRVRATATRIARGLAPMNPPLSTWMIGPTGIRKTSSILTKYGLEKIYSPLVSSKGDQLWWDNYESQPVLLLDEFASESLPIKVLLQLLDGSPLLLLPVKGGSTYVEFTQIFIIQNEEDSYQYAPPSIREALYRRCTPQFVTDAHEVRTLVEVERFQSATPPPSPDPAFAGPDPYKDNIFGHTAACFPPGSRFSTCKGHDGFEPIE